MTSESPLVDLRSAQISGNVDRRQMEDLPISGRDWLQLTTMVAGVTTTGHLAVRPVQPEPRRPADHAGNLGDRLRPARDQPRCDRRVPGGDQPLRRQHGQVGRPRGAGDLEVGKQLARRQLLRLFPRRQVEQRRSVHARRPAVPEPADRRHVRRADRPRQDALLRCLRARGAIRTPSTCTRRRWRRRTSTSTSRTTSSPSSGASITSSPTAITSSSAATTSTGCSRTTSARRRMRAGRRPVRAARPGRTSRPTSSPATGRTPAAPARCRNCASATTATTGPTVLPRAWS